MMTDFMTELCQSFGVAAICAPPATAFNCLFAPHQFPMAALPIVSVRKKRPIKPLRPEWSDDLAGLREWSERGSKTRRVPQKRHRKTYTREELTDYALHPVCGVSPDFADDSLFFSFCKFECSSAYVPMCADPRGLKSIFRIRRPHVGRTSTFVLVNSTKIVHFFQLFQKKACFNFFNLN